MTEPNGSRSPLGVVQHSYSLVNLCFCTRCLSLQGCSPRQSLMTLPPPARLRIICGRFWLSLQPARLLQSRRNKKKELDEIRYIFFRLATTLNCPLTNSYENPVLRKIGTPVVPNFIKFSYKCRQRFQNGWLVRTSIIGQKLEKIKRGSTLHLAFLTFPTHSFKMGFSDGQNSF